MVSDPGQGGLLGLLDDGLGQRILVFGTPPPDGRDLDLLVRPPERLALGASLADAGFTSVRGRWVPPAGAQSVAVECVEVADWALPASEAEALFAEAAPLDGRRHVAVPAPHHVLLIVARRLARGGELSAHQRARVATALARDPRAWERARARAGQWRAVAALRLLRAEIDRGATPTGWLRRLARGEQALAVLTSGRARSVLARRAAAARPELIAFCGLDGSGKSLQARRLQEALVARGVDAVVAWPPERNLLFRTPEPIKAVLKRVLAATASASGSSVEPAVPAGDPGEPRLEPLPEQRAPVTHALTTVVALAQGLALRRSVPRDVDVVIFDRHLLDAVVYIRHRWGGGRALPLQCALVRLIAPRALRAYLLDVPPETAYERKRDYPLGVLRERAEIYRAKAGPMGVRRLDGERSPSELADEITRDVLGALR